VTDDTSTDVEDKDFATSSTDDESDDANADVMDISNDEVLSIQTYYLLLISIDTLQIADMLPSKTMPEVNTKKKPMHALKPTTIKVAMVLQLLPKKKARACLVEVEEIEDKDSACNINVRNSGISPTSSFQIPGTKKVTHILYHKYFS
jgi:hypothetical protein